MSQRTPVIIGGIAAIIIIGAFIAFVTMQSDPTTTSTNTTPVATASPAPTSSVEAATTESSNVTNVSGVSDGTYETSINYEVPRGEANMLSVRITVNNGTVSEVTASTRYTEDDSERYANSFEKNISGAIKGKSLKGLSINRVGGASLTSEAFNRALQGIIDQAS